LDEVPHDDNKRQVAWSERHPTAASIAKMVLVSTLVAGITNSVTWLSAVGSSVVHHIKVAITWIP